MIRVKSKGNFSNTINYINKVKLIADDSRIKKYGEMGLALLYSATPKDTGLTSLSWKYRIEKNKDSTKLYFYNTNIQDGTPVAVVLQYGHAGYSGVWIEGRDYINPAINELTQYILNDIRKEVESK